MKLSFDFLAPKYYDFAVKRTQKPLVSKLNPLNQNDNYFLFPKDSLSNQPVLKHIVRTQIQHRPNKQTNSIPQNNPDSKKDISKDPIAGTQNNLNPDSTSEKIQSPKPTISKPQITVPYGVKSQMKAIIAPKNIPEIKRQLIPNQPPSLKRSIEVIKQHNSESKPPSIQLQFVTSNKLEQLFIAKQPDHFNNLQSTNKSDITSKVSEKSPILPTPTTSIFAPKFSQKPANHQSQSANVFGQKVPEKPSTLPIQSTSIFAPKFSQKPANHQSQSANVFGQKSLQAHQPGNLFIESTNNLVRKAPEKPSTSDSSKKNLFARRLQQNKQLKNPPPSQNNLFSRRLQENQIKAKIQFIHPLNPAVLSESNATTNNFSGPKNSKTQSSIFGQKVKQKQKDPVLGVNKQESFGMISNYGNSNLFGSSNSQGFNLGPTSTFTFQQANGRVNLSLDSNIGNVTASNNSSQLSKTVSTTSLTFNQNTFPKRPRPCVYPIRIQRQWEQAHGKKWYQLKSSQIPGAEESMKKRLNRQNATNQVSYATNQVLYATNQVSNVTNGTNPIITNTIQNQSRNSFHSAANGNGKGKPIFKF